MKKKLIQFYRHSAILLLGLVFALNVTAVKFYSVNTLLGISYRVTASICKDDNGFIWASSKTGILRLTDDDYRIYHLQYETAGAIFVKLIYEHSRLIAYTNNGQIFSYNPVFDRFDLMIDLRKMINNDKFDVYNLLIDHSGDFWIAVNSGLYRYHSGELTLVDEVLQERYSIAWHDDEHLIITKPTGFCLLNIKTLENKFIYENKGESPFLISSLFFDKIQNKLWIGTLSNGLFCFSFRSSTLDHILQSSLPRQPILVINENSESTILVGIDGQGVWELDRKDNKLLNIYKENDDDPYSLRGNGVYDIFYDRGKRVWICTYTGGVSFYPDPSGASPLVNQITHRTGDANSLVNNDVNGILEDRSGKIWFATNNGISCWDVAADHWKNYYFNKLEQAQVFLTLCEDDQGRIWAGSYSSGVYVLDEKTGKELAHYSGNGKEWESVSNYIFNIFKDSEGDLWIGGVNGKFTCYHPGKDQFRIYTDESISSFAELSPNQILMGCSYGVKLLNKLSGELKNILSCYVVQDLLVLNEEVWVCTSGEGILEYNYKSGALKRFTTKEGLPSNFVNSIAFADHCLWVGTESGLCRIKPKGKDSFSFASIVPLSGISYNKSALCKMRDGQLAWGTNNGAVFFTPQSVREISSKGKIFFQDLTISGRSIRELTAFKLDRPVDSLKTINLDYSQNTISLELISIGMPSGSKFSWKLERFDKDWTYPSGNRIITYANIPSGDFELKIKLYDNSLTNVIAERSITIGLIPPFWRTGWFLMIIILVLSGLIVIYMLYYINQLKQEHTEEKVRFFTNTAHDIRTSLTLIKAPVEELNKEKNLSESGRYYLNLAIEQARQLSLVVTQLMDFQKGDIGKEHLMLSMTDIVKLVTTRKVMLASYAKSKNITLELVSNRERYLTAVDEPKTEKIIDNLISNAIKYSGENSQIQIELRCDDKRWVLQVNDNGIGISRKAQRQLFKEFYRGDNAINSKVVGSGIGLLLVKNYVAMHGGNISCSSQENVGSVFQVVIPFKSKLRESAATNAASSLRGTACPDPSGKQSVNQEKSTDCFTTFAMTPDNLQLSSDPPAISSTLEFDPEYSGEISSSKDMKVLIVEDNDDLLNFMKSILSYEFQVYTAVDGVKAWEFISKHIPDLVVSDIMMPNRNGFELCRIMKSTYETSHIPIILLTALSEKTDQLNGLGLGADDYLTKPFDMNLLIQRIKSIIRNREVVREKALRMITPGSSGNILDNELNDKFVKKMLEVAQTNISNTEFDKDKFASEMNVSSSLLYKKIKSLTDQSPTDFIKTVRLNHAMELLQSRKYSITEVSELCGFASVGYFSTVFRKHFGKSPSEIAE